MRAAPGDRPVWRALVLAAGKSTRIREVAGDRPKPLLPLAGQAVLERNLRQLAAAGVGEAWINLHYRGEQIQAFIGDGERYGLRVQYSWEPELLGTAGAAKKLERVLGDDTFLVVYGDDLIGLDAGAMIVQHHRRSALATLAVFDRDRVPNPGLARGRVVLGKDRRVASFEEGGTSQSPYVNAGFYVLEPAVLAEIPAGRFWDFGHDVLPGLVGRGARVDAYPDTSYCLSIDTPDALVRAETLVRDLDLFAEGVHVP